MSDPFEESPWGDQVSLSNNNSGASSIHDHPNVEAVEGVDAVGGVAVAVDAVDTGDVVGVATNIDIDNENDNDNDSKTTSTSTSSDIATTHDTTHSAIAAAGLLEIDSSIPPPAKTPERNSGKTRVTPKRLTNRSRKVITQPVFEEDTSTDPLGPLGPLGDANDSSSNVSNIDNGDDDTSSITNRLATTSLSPTKERNSNAATTATTNAIPGSASLFQDVPLNYPASAETDTSSIATNPTTSSGTSPDFQISVFDPIKVGDITSAHTVYTVHCKTNSPAFSKSEMAVTRRYRDFRWVFHALEHNNPGIIIPPPPDKQAVGRFNEDFVEQRRSALENMLKKIAVHPILKNDGDFRLFLESEAFSNDIKNRVMSSDEIDAATSITGSSTSSGSGGGGGFMGTLGGAFSFSAKFIETSQWFIDKKNYLDSLEAQLKSLAKALDLVVNQRKELSDVTGEFAVVLEALADVEISKSLSELLIAFSESQTRIQNLYSRQCLQDILSLSTTIDEYLRLISSVRSVFLQRQKAYFAVQSAEHELTKKQTHLDKLHRQGKTLQDKIAALQQDVETQEKKVLNQRVAFDDISKRIVIEFDRLEHERIHDFRNSVELFLENAVESQKEAIEVWETFYQRSFVANATVTANS